MDTFTHLERATMQWLVQSYQRRTLRRAVRQAYFIFARRNPQWVAALFDEHFIHTHLLPLLQRAADRGDKVTPAQVAETWARQVSMLPSLRQQHTARMIPAATHFLCMVADEIPRHSCLSGIFPRHSSMGINGILVETQVGRDANVLVETAVG